MSKIKSGCDEGFSANPLEIGNTGLESLLRSAKEVVLAKGNIPRRNSWKSREGGYKCNNLVPRSTMI